MGIKTQDSPKMRQGDRVFAEFRQTADCPGDDKAPCGAREVRESFQGMKRAEEALYFIFGGEKCI